MSPIIRRATEVRDSCLGKRERTHLEPSCVCHAFPGSFVDDGSDHGTPLSDCRSVLCKGLEHVTSELCSPESTLSSDSISELPTSSTQKQRTAAPLSCPPCEDIKMDAALTQYEPQRHSGIHPDSSHFASCTSEPVNDAARIPGSLSAFDILFLRHVRQLESDLRPSSSYLDLATSQNRIRPAMRGILLSWLSEVAMQFELGPGCLLLASSLLDRYLSKWPETSRCTLQMLGTCCLMIAAKYDETVYPSASQFVEMANDSFTKKQLLACERHVLEAVGYRIYAPVASNILQTYKELLWPSTQDCISAADEIQSRVILLATYLVEVATMEYKMLKYLPSTVAAAAIAVASDALGMPLAMKEADFLVALAAPGMWQAANDLLALHVTAYNVHDEDVSSPFLAIKEKYSLALWGSVACIAPANPLAVASWERSDSVTGALVPCGSQDRMRHLYVGETSVINSS